MQANPLLRLVHEHVGSFYVYRFELNGKVYYHGTVPNFANPNKKRSNANNTKSNKALAANQLNVNFNNNNNNNNNSNNNKNVNYNDDNNTANIFTPNTYSTYDYQSNNTVYDNGNNLVGNCQYIINSASIAATTNNNNNNYYYYNNSNSDAESYEPLHSDNINIWPQSWQSHIASQNYSNSNNNNNVNSSTIPQLIRSTTKRSSAVIANSHLQSTIATATTPHSLSASSSTSLLNKSANYANNVFCEHETPLHMQSSMTHATTNTNTCANVQDNITASQISNYPKSIASALFSYSPPSFTHTNANTYYHTYEEKNNSSSKFTSTPFYSSSACFSSTLPNTSQNNNNNISTTTINTKDCNNNNSQGVIKDSNTFLCNSHADKVYEQQYQQQEQREVLERETIHITHEPVSYLTNRVTSNAVETARRWMRSLYSYAYGAPTRSKNNSTKNNNSNNSKSNIVSNTSMNKDQTINNSQEQNVVTDNANKSSRDAAANSMSAYSDRCTSNICDLNRENKSSNCARDVSNALGNLYDVQITRKHQKQTSNSFPVTEQLQEEEYENVCINNTRNNDNNCNSLTAEGKPYTIFTNTTESSNELQEITENTSYSECNLESPTNIYNKYNVELRESTREIPYESQSHLQTNNQSEMQTNEKSCSNNIRGSKAMNENLEHSSSSHVEQYISQQSPLHEITNTIQNDNYVQEHREVSNYYFTPVSHSPTSAHSRSSSLLTHSSVASHTRLARRFNHNQHDRYQQQERSKRQQGERHCLTLPATYPANVISISTATTATATATTTTTVVLGDMRNKRHHKTRQGSYSNVRKSNALPASISSPLHPLKRFSDVGDSFV